MNTKTNTAQQGEGELLQDTSIKTWQERSEIAFKGDAELLERKKSETVMDAMRSEITELRAALAQRTGSGEAQWTFSQDNDEGCFLMLNQNGDRVGDIYSIGTVRKLEALLTAPPAAVQPDSGPSAPTGISAQLRKYAANPGYSYNDYADVMRIAADECERFYGGMMAWKRTAETKDRKLSEEMTARINERVAARIAEQQPDSGRDASLEQKLAAANATIAELRGDRFSGRTVTAFTPTEAQCDEWLERHGVQPAYRDAFYDAASLYLVAAQPTENAAVQPLSKEQVDTIVYQCRQSGNDTTYDIVAACIAAASEKGGA